MSLFSELYRKVSSFDAFRCPKHSKIDFSLVPIKHYLRINLFDK